MRILKIYLENFQGVKKLAIELNGKDCRIYGDNGTGKSTIYNSFTWLMYGKASTGEKGFAPKTTGTHKLNHIVEMMIELEDGTQVTLKKDFHELYKTIKGNPTPVLSGHTTDHYIDGVPVSESQYKKRLTEIYENEEMAKILTSTSYFLEDMKVADRRRILLEMCGDVDFSEVVGSDPELAELPEVLRKPGSETFYTVDEFKTIATQKKKRVNDELSAIPGRVDEAEKAKPDVSGANKTEINSKIEELQKEQKQLELELTTREAESTDSIRKIIFELETKMAIKEAEHEKAKAEKNREIYEKGVAVRTELIEISKEIVDIETQIQQSELDVRQMKSRRERLLLEWESESSKEWSGADTCPTCGQPLPAEQIEKAKAAFNIKKSQKLSELSELGNKSCSMNMIEAEELAVQKHKSELATLEEKRKALVDSLENLNSESGAVRFKETEEARQLAGQMEELKKQLESEKMDISIVSYDLVARLKEVKKELETEQEKKAKLAMVVRQNARIADLERQEKELAGEYEQLQKDIYLCDRFTKAKTKMLDERINSCFKTLRFRLFIEQQNGGLADDCEAMIPCEGKMVPFKSANNAARVNASLEMIDALSSFYKVELPIFVDNSESVTRFNETKSQLIRLIVSEPDKELRVEIG